MPTFCIDPLTDHRWAALVEEDPRASVFHTPEWLGALQKTYGYAPFVVTASGPAEPRLSSGLVLCRVDSWLTGKRVVSLPFSDHCDPLTRVPQDVEKLLNSLGEGQAEAGTGYLEVRPTTRIPCLSENPWTEAGRYKLHWLDLRPSLDAVFRRFHKSCIQRKIRKAECANLEYDAGFSPGLLSEFYRLHVSTRRRHGAPPQPAAWFRNLADLFGNRLTIHMARRSGRPVASILTIQHRDTLTYKYGCSDKKVSHLGATPFLFWQAILKAKKGGLTKFDLGRSDISNPGLIRFKIRLGAESEELTYHRMGERLSTRKRSTIGLARILFKRMPEVLLPAVGKLIYKHLGLCIRPDSPAVLV